MKKIIKLLALISLQALASLAFSQTTSPVGLWHTIDDQTGKPAGEIRISEKGDGTLVGVIMKSLQPRKPTDDPNCSLCTDDRKDKPRIGMELIRGAKQTTGSNMWEGGTIVDPNSGKIYKLRLMPVGEKSLQVRGYAGPFFRTQTWMRVE